MHAIKSVVAARAPAAIKPEAAQVRSRRGKHFAIGRKPRRVAFSLNPRLSQPPPSSPNHNTQPAAPTPRRAALAGIAAAVLAVPTLPATAAYGDAARVFGGKPTNATGFVPATGDGFALDLPARWTNPSKERPFPGTVAMYQDSGDLTNSITILKPSSGKNSVKDYGSPEAVLDQLKYLLGDSTAYTGQTVSEGGFAPNKIAAASLLGIQEYKKGNTDYYSFDVLTRTADGDEGGRHNLIVAAVSPTTKDLTVLHIVVGDKRWFKGASVGANGCAQSFTVV